MKTFLVANMAYGFGSWGDEMILDGVLNRLGRDNCIVVSHDPEETEHMHQVEAISDTGAAPPFEVLYVGGGGWGFWPLAGSIVSLVLRAQDLGHDVVIDAAGLRPDVAWDNDWAKPLRNVKYMSVRDETSRRCARDLLRMNCPIAPDPSQYMSVTPMPMAGKWVGINVVNDATAFPLLVPWCKEALDRGYGLLGLVTIAHKTADGLNGHTALATLGDMIGHEIVDVRGEWYDMSLGPREIAGLTQNCERVLAMRKHGGLVAKRVGAYPVLADWYADHGRPWRLQSLREVIGGEYWDLHVGEVPKWQ